MEMKYVVPDMAQSFGTLEFAGESEPVFERDKNNRRVLARRSYNLYSDVQKGENVVVEIPVQAGEKKFKYEQKVKLVKRLRDLENGQCLLQDLYGRVGVVQIHPVFEELLHAFDTRPPVQRNEVE